MSADNGIYILETKDEFRVIHAQAIENIYWHFDCCDNPNVVEIDNDDIYYHERCTNCGTEDPLGRMKDTINPQMLKMYFGGSKVFKTRKEAEGEAYRMLKEAEYCGICEYGIQNIRGFEDKEFPNAKIQ
jgi:hypothetical protein